jgi:hypothetical protein
MGQNDRMEDTFFRERHSLKFAILQPVKIGLLLVWARIDQPILLNASLLIVAKLIHPIGRDAIIANFPFNYTIGFFSSRGILTSLVRSAVGNRGYYNSATLPLRYFATFAYNPKAAAR